MDLYLCEPVGPFAAVTRSTASFTTKQDVTPGPVPVISAGKLRPGSKIYLHADGEYSTTGTPSITLGFWFGTRQLVITGDIALSSVLSTVAATAWPWRMEWNGVCTGVGTAGTLVGNGKVQLGGSLITYNAETPIPVTQALRTVAIDTTIERALGVSCTWSASSASNIIGVTDFRALILN